jgi:uncharacterized protein (TIGR03083 family)
VSAARPGRALIDYGRLLEVLGVEAELLATAVHGQRRERQVPACPGLNLGETARHVGGMYRSVLRWLCDGQEPGEVRPEPAPGQELSDFVRSGLGPLLGELAAHDPAESCSTWWPEDMTHGFWRRRLAHETTVHRIDVQGAAGLPIDPVPEDVVIDGVDEVLSFWFGHRLPSMGVSGTREGTVAIHLADRVWLAGTGPDGCSARPATYEEAKSADALVTGTPTNLYLWLWGRASDRQVEAEGDADSVAQLWALLRLATK